MTLIICESLREIGEIACVTSAWSSPGQTLIPQQRNYLNSSVEKFLVFSEILQATKWIRVVQLTLEFLLIFIDSKDIRQAAILFHALQLAKTLAFYFCFSNNASIESSFWYFFSKVNGFEISCYHFCYSVCRSNHYRGQKPIEIDACPALME